jgi:hypothetical protein
MKLSNTQVKLLYIVLTQTEDGRPKQYPIDKQDDAIQANASIKEACEKRIHKDEKGVEHMLIEFKDIEIEPMSTEVKAFFIEQLKRPFGVEDAEISKELISLLNK